MACANPNLKKSFEPPLPQPAGSFYTLSVVGPAGTFSAFASYDDPTTEQFVHWSPGDIVNKKKTQLLTLSGEHIINISIGTIVPGVAVEVRAEVRQPSGTTITNCHPVNTANSAELNFHMITVV